MRQVSENTGKLRALEGLARMLSKNRLCLVCYLDNGVSDDTHMSRNCPENNGAKDMMEKLKTGLRNMIPRGICWTYLFP